MIKINIYHGTYKEIKYPEIRIHKFTKDFSWGFYCTKYKQQAEKWSNKFKTSIVNEYTIDNLEDLKILEFKDYSNEWLDFVVKCRSGETHEYDVVVGPMSDDTIYDYLDAYLEEQMNEEEFFKLMKFKYPTHQISFHTIKSLSKLNFVKSYHVQK